MKFLYENLIEEFGKRFISQTELPVYLEDNLKHKLRPYQEDAFRHFIVFDENDFDTKPPKPYHLLYNMATGSGKTLIMAGLILYLYRKGYRNFLFFVNSNNIIHKTKENFLNPIASKYLFKDHIFIDGKEVWIKEVNNFEESDEENINIKFTTIQQLHLDLNDTKENSITYEDFRDKKIVLIADEAHHLSSATRNQGNLFGSWEGTVLEILKQNYDNILLEFTATLDYESREIAEKYKDKVIFRYDLKQFRLDGYSKEISLIRSLYDEKDRILQALILNLYRQVIATQYNINLKPVILFKAKRTIKESEKNKENFHKLIDELNEKDIEHIRETSTVEIVQRAFAFFDKLNITTNEIVSRLKDYFKPENCISANNDAEAEKNQILLNTLEDEDNPIRAVFAVQKLNEGWDVLNLFDIVRLYEGRDGRAGNPGKTTISEAQLIGRGARYYPFKIEEGQDPYRRKYDNDPFNDLRVLEELYYHTKEDVKYISELKKALIETGIYDDEDMYEIKELKLKPSFKNTDFYKRGKVIYNKKIPKTYNHVKSFKDLGVKKVNHQHTLSSGFGQKTEAFNFLESYSSNNEMMEQKDVKLSEIPKHVVRYALTTNPFFYFSNLQRFFPNLNSTDEFITSHDYMGDLEITFRGPRRRLENITHKDYLQALIGLLSKIEEEIKGNLTEYTGSPWKYDYIQNVFTDKKIKVRKDNERAQGQENFLEDKDWYVYNANYGTSEEKKFVELFARRYEHIEPKFEEIYIIRNERVLKIYDKNGRAFEPDFLLFARKKNGEEIIYQVFIEPKGKHLRSHDKWKEDFLKELRNKNEILEIHTDKYLITGIPFYNYDNENEFKRQLEEVLNINT